MYTGWACSFIFGCWWGFRMTNRMSKKNLTVFAFIIGMMITAASERLGLP